ncbi:MAG: putative zinc-binding metallopeptidase, partial [Rubrivivax sp.]
MLPPDTQVAIAPPVVTPTAFGHAADAGSGSPPSLAARPLLSRAFVCVCGRPVFFRNSACLACGTPLGYMPGANRLMALAPAGDELWREASNGDHAPERPACGAPLYRRCGNLLSAAACNWLLEPDDAGAGAGSLCRCCRLTRTLPDLTMPGSAVRWQRIELAKRRLVSSLIARSLPVRSRVTEDPFGGLAFDLLHTLPGGPPVVTGHVDGVITLDVQEADDAHREQRRTEMGESYRTLLGHLRHETGHYYWQRMVAGGDWLAAFRETFGDERQDYGAALALHYGQGAPADWGQRFVSAYASSHPWEDWAETWAHYLHLVDTLDTARSFAVDGERVELTYERFAPQVLAPEAADEAQATEFLQLINSWMELTGVLNELSRSMGVA